MNTMTALTLYELLAERKVVTVRPPGFEAENSIFNTYGSKVHRDMIAWRRFACKCISCG